MVNLWAIWIGFASIADGLIMIFSLGFCRAPGLRLAASTSYILWEFQKEQEAKDRAWMRSGAQYK